MKPKIILGLALVLSCGVFDYCLTSRADTNTAPVSTNSAQSNVLAAAKTNWTDARVTLYRTTGVPVELNAKRETVTLRDGPFDAVAFVDPDTGKAWVGTTEVGSIPGVRQMFYLETESGIVCGKVLFGLRGHLGGGPRQDIYGVAVAFQIRSAMVWERSLVPSPKGGGDLDALTRRFDTNGDLRLVDIMPEERRTRLADNFNRVEYGLNPYDFEMVWPAAPTIEAIEVKDGRLRLELHSPTGNHKANVWIDLKTWQVVKGNQDGTP